MSKTNVSALLTDVILIFIGRNHTTNLTHLQVRFVLSIKTLFSKVGI